MMAKKEFYEKHDIENNFNDEIVFGIAKPKKTYKLLIKVKEPIQFIPSYSKDSFEKLEKGDYIAYHRKELGNYIDDDFAPLNAEICSKTYIIDNNDIEIQNSLLENLLKVHTEKVHSQFNNNSVAFQVKTPSLDMSLIYKNPNKQGLNTLTTIK